MKRLFDGDVSLEDLKKIICDIRDKEDRRDFYVMIAIFTAVLTALVATIIYLVKKKNDDKYDDEWDSEWDDEFASEENAACDCNDCCCTDKDVDDSVKIEKL